MLRDDRGDAFADGDRVRARGARAQLGSRRRNRKVPWGAAADTSLPELECQAAVPHAAIAMLRTRGQMIILYNRHLTAELVRLMGLLEAAGRRAHSSRPCR